MLQLLSDWLWGYDFFISYAHADGTLIENGRPRSRYARELTAALRQRRFAVFHDETEFSPGDELNAATVRRVRSSSKLLIIARPWAMQSAWVLKEATEAIAAGIDVVVIDINGTYGNTPAGNPLRQLVGDTRLREPDILDDIDNAPSLDLINKLSDSGERARRDHRRKHAILTTLTGVLLLVSVLLIAGRSLWVYHSVNMARASLRAIGADIDGRSLELSRADWSSATRREWADIERDIVTLVSLGNLEDLKLTGIGVGSLAFMKDAPDLSAFYLDGSFVTPNSKHTIDWGAINDAGNLSRLVLRYTPPFGNAAEHWRTDSRLQEIRLTGVPVTARGVELLLERAPELRQLMLRDCPGLIVNIDLARRLASIELLEELSISGVQVEEAACRILSNRKSFISQSINDEGLFVDCLDGQGGRGPVQ